MCKRAKCYIRNRPHYICEEKQNEILSPDVLSIHRAWHTLLLWEGVKKTRIQDKSEISPERWPNPPLRPISGQKVFYFPNNLSAWKDHPLSVRFMPLSSAAIVYTQWVQQKHTHTHTYNLLILTCTSYIPLASLSVPVISWLAWQDTHVLAERTRSCMNIACKCICTYSRVSVKSSHELPSFYLLSAPGWCDC